MFSFVDKTTETQGLYLLKKAGNTDILDRILNYEL